MSVGSFFKRLFLIVGGKIKDAIKALVASPEFRATLASDLGRIAKAVVAELMAGNLPASERREEAFTRIVAEAIAAGLDFKEHFVRLLIEMAVAEYKTLAGN